MTTRPDSTEYAPHYEKYITLVPDGDIVSILGSQLENTLGLLRPVSEEKGDYAYAPGKWTIKQVLGHLIDAERVFAYRALRIGRNDKTPLQGFEQDDFVANANFNARTLGSLIEEFAAVRRSNICLFESFGEQEWERRGTANEKEVSTRALVYIVAGHESHHMGILRSHYLAV